MSIILELTLAEASAVAVALVLLAQEETAGPISERWQRDGGAVADRLAILRDEAERAEVNPT